MYGGSGVCPSGSRRAAAASGPRRDARAARPARSGGRPSRRVGRARPSQIVVLEPLEQQHLAPRGVDPDARRNDLVSLTTTSVPAQLLRQLAKAGAAPPRSRARRRAAATRPAAPRDAARSAPAEARSPARRRPSDVDGNVAGDGRGSRAARDGAVAGAAEGRTEPAAVDAALERAREQVEALAATAARARGDLPARVGDAVQDGLREQVLPVARHLAEVRGLMNQVIRRLERLEGDLLAERHARVDDLALLVDLVSSGWRGVDQRLARVEQGLEQRAGAVVYRIERDASA